MASPDSSPATAKLLSICIMGRDDTYMVDFRYRLVTTVEYLARNLTQLGRLDDVEVVFTDWGSTPPLAQTLALSPAAKRLCRLLYVPPAVLTMAQGNAHGFHTTLALNAALRRATGRYVLLFNADQLLTAPCLARLLAYLDGTQPGPCAPDRTLLMLARYNVPWSFVRRQPELEALDEYLHTHTAPLRREVGAWFCIGSGSGGFALPRAVWHDLHGLDEQMQGWGWNDIDFCLRATRRYPWTDLENLGVWCFHLAHPEAGEAAAARAAKPPATRLHPATVNDEHWGLGRYELEEFPVRATTAPPLAMPATLAPAPAPASGALAAWPVTCSELVAQTQAGASRDALKLTLEGCSGLPRRDRLDLLFLLGWYARERRPQRYLDYGWRGDHAPLVVANLAGDVDVYAAGRWDACPVSESPEALAIALAEQARGFSGQVRFLLGDPTDALARLRATFPGTFYLDLVLLRLSEFTSAEALACVTDVLPWLRPGGALVLADEIPTTFEALWPQLLAAYPAYSFIRQAGSPLGVLLAATCAGQRLATTVPGFGANLVWDDIDPTLGYRLRRALSRPSQYRRLLARLGRRD